MDLRFLGLIGLAGCAPYGPLYPTDTDNGGDVPPHSMIVEPVTLDFGEISVGQGEVAAPLKYSVANAGANAFYLFGYSEVLGDSDDVGFSVQAGDEPLMFGRHVRMDFEVLFEPTQDGYYERQISLNSGEAVVTLKGDALAPRMTVPDVVDVGATVGCADRKLVLVANDGREPLHVTPGTVGQGLSWSDTTEQTVAPGDEVALFLDFAPKVAGQATTTVELLSNDPADWQQSRVIDVETIAASDGDARLNESFLFESDLQMSLLIVADTRSGMDSYLDGFIAEVGDLVDGFDALGADVNIATVTGVDGNAFPATEPMVVSSTSPTSATNTIVSALGIEGDDYSQDYLLQYTLDTVLETRVGGQLTDLVRPDTRFEILVIAGGAEHSAMTGDDFAITIPGSSPVADTRINVVTPSEDGCSSVYRDDTFAEAATNANGSVYDLCGDWDDTVDQIVGDLTPTDFYVTHALAELPADPDAIEVLADEVPLGVDDWFYDPDTNTVHVSMGLDLEVGTAIRVSYLPASACD